MSTIDKKVRRIQQVKHGRSHSLGWGHPLRNVTSQSAAHVGSASSSSQAMARLPLTRRRNAVPIISIKPRDPGPSQCQSDAQFEASETIRTAVARWKQLIRESLGTSEEPPEVVAATLARGSMDQAVSMPHHVRTYSVTSLIHGPPFQHPVCKASIPVATSGALPPVTAAVRVHSTLHHTTVSPGYSVQGLHTKPTNLSPTAPLPVPHSPTPCPPQPYCLSPTAPLPVPHSPTPCPPQPHCLSPTAPLPVPHSPTPCPPQPHCLSPTAPLPVPHSPTPCPPQPHSLSPTAPLPVPHSPTPCPPQPHSLSPTAPLPVPTKRRPVPTAPLPFRNSMEVCSRSHPVCSPGGTPFPRTP